MYQMSWENTGEWWCGQGAHMEIDCIVHWKWTDEDCATEGAIDANCVLYFTV